MISKEVKVGLFMVVSLVLLYLGFNYLKGIDFFSSTKKYYAVYTNVDKLMPSNQVYINGYSVGRVSDIKFEQQRNRVIVEIELDSDIILGDSTIAMLNGDILGTKFIQLYVGSINKPLKPKDTLRSEIAKGIAEFLTESAAPVANNLQTTLRKLNAVLDNLASNSAKLDEIFNDFKSTPKLLNRTLSNTNSKIDSLAINLNLVTRNVNGVLAELKPTLSNFKTFSDSLQSVELNKTLTKAQQALGKMNETLSRLNKGDNTMSKLMTEDTLYVNLNKLLLSLDTLAKHFNENPKHFLAPLGKSKNKIERDLDQQRKEEKKK
jgi:phospholipid/cholesterol/gamma-HCH transport system substrate-binding protein